MALSIAFPAIDPVLIQLGPVAIRWYSLAYVAGLILGWVLARRLVVRVFVAITRDQIDDFLTWATVGVILGGRLGYVLVYNPGHYMEHPLQIFAIWQGGMSFHGGFAGVILAAILFCRKRKIPLLVLSDVLACTAPIGLFFGRLANFINGELYGRVSDAPWAMIFPAGGPYPRHPSQLYQAALEGIVLFIVAMVLIRMERMTSRPGIVTGVFFVGYGLARTFVEVFRQPDAHIGFLTGGSTMGQLLSLPMIAIGIGFIFYAVRKGNRARQ